jgi:GT2 family glycosyltransferase
MPVVVAGMHRSGTSMVAKALHQAGLNFGRDEDLYKATPENPDGYWEHVRFVALNDEILCALGGGWDRLPRVPDRWRHDARLKEIHRKAKRLVSEFDDQEPWGWKDPRNSVTLALWMEILPELKVVVCLRNPLEVALSLHQRYMSYSTALELWETYNRRLLESTAPERRIVTNYQAWFERPTAEFKRVSTFLGLPVTSAAQSAAREVVDSSLRHNDFTPADLIRLEVAPSVIALYSHLCAEGEHPRGSRGRRIGARAQTPPPLATEEPKVNLDRLSKEMMRRRIDRLAQQLDEKETSLGRMIAVERDERLRRQTLGEKWSQLSPRVDRIETRLEVELSDALRLAEGIQLGIGRLEKGHELIEARIEQLEQASALTELKSHVLKQIADVQRSQEQLVVRVEELQSSVYDLQATEALAGGDPDYRRLARRIKEVVRESLPFDATVLMVSKGDESLTNLYGRRGWHFPRSEEGLWAGYHPATSLPAVAHLEALRARGADHIVFPAPSLWWLEKYPGLRSHLEIYYRNVPCAEDVCAVYSLSDRNPISDWRVQLHSLVAEFRYRHGRDAALLDWNTQADLERLLPEQTIFSPPGLDNGLPYADRSIDLVAVTAAVGDGLEDAKRVAATAVITVPPGGTNGSSSEIWWRDRQRRKRLPSVSVVIPCFDGLAHTRACVGTLRESLPPSFDGEIIVVDDASSDGTGDWLRQVAADDDRIRVIRNPSNRGFLRSANRGAQAATGDLLLFLNNDTILLPGWLEPLVRVFTDRSDAGAVGGRLLYPDGRLQEAGGVVFSDGSAWKYGYGDPNPEAAPFARFREADYCSGCLLATPRALFQELSAFDSRFAPGFYEDTDYCFAVRKHGLRVYYQPESTIVHVEGGTAGVDLGAGAKRYQVLNESKFARKWRRELKKQPSRPAVFDARAVEALILMGGSGFASDDAS